MLPVPPVSVLVPLLVSVPEVLMPPVPESVSVPLTRVIVPVLLRAVALLSVNVPSMVMPPEVLEALVSAPDVLSVAPLVIDTVPPVALVRPLLTVSVPAVTSNAPELLVPVAPPFNVLVPLLVSVAPLALLIPPVLVSLNVPLTRVIVPVLLRAVALLSVNVPSMVMPPEVLEALVSAPEVVSVAPLAIDIVEVAKLVRLPVTDSVPLATFSAPPELLIPPVPPASVLVPVLVTVPELVIPPVPLVREPPESESVPPELTMTFSVPPEFTASGSPLAITRVTPLGIVIESKALAYAAILLIVVTV